ncbi:hypothetical protein K8T06_03490, partial [bacterium]|nr:hypothetical protein [bacterium]
MWNDWIEEYPIGHRKNLKSRIKSDDKRQHLPAVQKMIIYQIFKKTGFDVKINPKLDSGKTPDFLVTKNGKIYTFIESTSRFDSEKIASQKNVRNRILDFL